MLWGRMRRNWLVRASMCMPQVCRQQIFAKPAPLELGPLRGIHVDLSVFQEAVAGRDCYPAGRQTTPRSKEPHVSPTHPGCSWFGGNPDITMHGESCVTNSKSQGHQNPGCCMCRLRCFRFPETPPRTAACKHQNAAQWRCGPGYVQRPSRICDRGS